MKIHFQLYMILRNKVFVFEMEYLILHRIRTIRNTKTIDIKHFKISSQYVYSLLQHMHGIFSAYNELDFVIGLTVWSSACNAASSCRRMTLSYSPT